MTSRRGLIVALLAGAMPAGAQSHILTGTEGRVEHLRPSDADRLRIVGSYEIRICRRGSDCVDDSSRDALQKSFVSIQSDSIQLMAFDPDTRDRLEIGSVGHGPWNACYIAGPRLHRSGNYASMSSMGLFATEPTPGSPVVKLSLGASVDADYDVDATIVDGRLEGVGRSSMVGNDLHVPADTVVGRRIGPPDAQRCLDVVGAVPGIVRRHVSPRVPMLVRPTAPDVPLRASDRGRFPARLGAYTREGPVTTTAGVSSASYVNGGTRVEVSTARILGDAEEVLGRAAVQFDSSFDSAHDSVTANGARYAGVSAAVVKKDQGDVAMCLFYAFVLGKVLLRETAVIPASQIATTDVPLFAHELARQVVRSGRY